MDSFGQRCIFKSFSFIACDTHFPIRIKTQGEVRQAIQQAMLMCISLTRTRTIPILSVADAFNWIAMVLIPASVLTRVFSKTASALSQTQNRCESYGIMSLMQILVKLEKPKILSTGTRTILYSLDIQTYIPTRFYSRIQDLRCKVPCEGKPIMRLRGEVHSYFSYYFWHLHFILLQGSVCLWTKLLHWVFSVENDGERQAPIPRNVNEDMLSKLMDGNGVLPDSNVTSSSKCTLTVHPKVGLKSCCE